MMLSSLQAAYIDKITSKVRHGVPLSREQYPKTSQEAKQMKAVPYASAIGSLMYAMLCTRPDICFAISMISMYESNPRPLHWIMVNHILKYLWRTRDYMLVYHSEDLTPTSYTNYDFQSDRDSWRSTSVHAFYFGWWSH
jgi:hypothetical protein